MLFRNSVILVAVGVFIMIINACTIVRWGRRRVMLISGLLLCGIVQLIIAAIYDAMPTNESVPKAVIGLSVVYIIGYNGMISSYAWASGGELPSQRLRSYTFGMAAAVGVFGTWLATFTAPYFINPASLNWGPRNGYIWAPSCFLTAVWVGFYLPEVKGRTLEEVDEMFAARLPARKFRKYQCIGMTRHDTSPSEKDEKEAVETIERVSVDQKGASKVAETIVNPL
ncbi:hypothetical protein AC579_9958 [Pseudocercospora musae]|uniref:Major facilitator superfamily (MFS) profile domain-containing protein n=1 Tax=Pseudocercospora musae TaxID=113226 RepID=A0A139ILB8_9PEZI|nr:hypothetical protein AC579_9958 [Pseudocercospora musae]